jgi:hypothetical protein
MVKIEEVPYSDTVPGKMSMYRSDMLALLLYLVLVNPQDDEILHLIKSEEHLVEIPSESRVAQLKEFYENRHRNPDPE